MSQVQIKKVSWWHESIIEWMITNPEDSLGACAAFFNVSQSWLSTIINSDVFRERLAQQREAHFANTSRTVQEKVSGLADLSVEVLEERIQAERESIPLGIVRDAADLALKASGFSPTHQQRGGNRTTNILQVVNGGKGGVDREVLAEAREQMNQLAALAPPSEEDEEVGACTILPPAT
jgi:hypothetical protein